MVSNEFRRRYKAAVAQQNAARRRAKFRRKGPWDKQYLGMIKKPQKGEPNDGPSDHGVHPPPDQ